MLHEAEADKRHALETAQRLSHPPQNAENRIAQLKAEVQLYKAKNGLCKAMAPQSFLWD
jgi:hypothetical protein